MKWLLSVLLLVASPAFAQQIGGFTHSTGGGVPSANGPLGVTQNWTPTFGGTTTNPTVTYSSQVGKITYTGNIFWYYYWISWSAFSGGSGNITVIGLPATQSSSGNFYSVATCGSYSGFTSPGANYSGISATVSPGSNTLGLQSSGFGVSAVALAITLVGTSGVLVCQGWGSTQ